jgi:hypothetical protein
MVTVAGRKWRHCHFLLAIQVSQKSPQQDSLLGSQFTTVVMPPTPGSATCPVPQVLQCKLSPLLLWQSLNMQLSSAVNTQPRSSQAGLLLRDLNKQHHSCSHHNLVRYISAPSFKHRVLKRFVVALLYVWSYGAPRAMDSAPGLVPSCQVNLL